MQCDEIKKKICEVEDKIADVHNKYKELKEDMDDSLAAERQENNDDLREFNAESEEKTF